MERHEELEKNRTTYLAGLETYQRRGIPIVIDGRVTEPSDWEKIFQIHEDGSFYMGDYILEENDHENGMKKTLKEIRFDKVYYR